MLVAPSPCEVADEVRLGIVSHSAAHLNNLVNMSNMLLYHPVGSEPGIQLQ